MRSKNHSTPKQYETRIKPINQQGLLNLFAWLPDGTSRSSFLIENQSHLDFWMCCNGMDVLVSMQ